MPPTRPSKAEPRAHPSLRSLPFVVPGVDAPVSAGRMPRISGGQQAHQAAFSAALSRGGIVIAATPSTTQASPIHAVGDSRSPRKITLAPPRSAPADRPARWCRPSRASGSGGNRSRRPPPSRTPQARAAPRPSLPRASAVQGCSTTRPSGISTAVPQSKRARSRRHRVEAGKTAAEDRAAGIADGRGHDRDLGHQLLAD